MPVKEGSAGKYVWQEYLMEYPEHVVFWRSGPGHLAFSRNRLFATTTAHSPQATTCLLRGRDEMSAVRAETQLAIDSFLIKSLSVIFPAACRFAGINYSE